MATRTTMPNINESRKVKKVLKDPNLGKSTGTGLDDYNLDIMTLE